jgi:hypothetical protein
MGEGCRHRGALMTIGAAALFGVNTPVATLLLGLTDRLQHDHAAGNRACEPHSHRHRHNLLVRPHPHSPDLHHRHEHA